MTFSVHRPTRLLLAALLSLQLGGCASYIGARIVEPPRDGPGALRMNAEAREWWETRLSPALFSENWIVEAPDGSPLFAALIPAGFYPHLYEFRIEGSQGEVEFRIDDRWLFQAGRRASATVVLVHGWMTDHRQILPHAMALASKGFDVVVMDQRGHGRSGGEHVTFGAREAGDLVALLDGLNDRQTCRPLFVAGFSMGGSVALLAAAARPEVDGWIAVAPYADPAEILPLGLREMAPFWIRPWLTSGRMARAVERAEHQADFRFTAAAPAGTAASVTAPVLLIHGERDRLVPPGQSELLSGILPDAELLLVPERGHVDLIADRDTVIEAMLAWLGRQPVNGLAPERARCRSGAKPGRHDELASRP